MIELPEALTIARQLNDELRGRRIAACVRGNAPHKFAFYSYEPAEYAALMAGRAIGGARAYGGHILVAIDPGYTLVLGGGGERILYHRDARSLPKKHQLLVQFVDGTSLSVTVQMWGFAKLLDAQGLAEHHFCQEGVSPLSREFTPAYLGGLLDALPPDDPRSVKYFLISRPGILGVGNGYTQDILFHARLDHRRRAASLGAEERRALYEAICSTLGAAAELGGRDDERDLYGRPGGYHRLLHSGSVGQPCPTCGTPIRKMQFLGGATYYCPHCQV